MGYFNSEVYYRDITDSLIKVPDILVRKTVEEIVDYIKNNLNEVFTPGSLKDVKVAIERFAKNNKIKFTNSI